VSDQQDQIGREISCQIAAASFPGAVVGIARNGSISYLEAFGYAVALPEKIPAAGDTVYDTASLTKPLITANLVLQMIQDGLLTPETPLGEIFDGCPDDKRAITIADLLCHCGGLPWWYPLFAGGRSIADYRDIILELPLSKPPRVETIYSCPGYILLAAIVEAVLQTPFSRAAEERILRPLKLRRTSLGKPEVPLREVAATEDSSFFERNAIQEFGLDYKFRDGVIWGEPHDTNSFAAGGSAGNSGLFSTVEEVLILTEQYGGRSQLLGEDVISLVGRNYTPYGPQQRTYGWQLASSPDCSAAPELSPDAVGHTGFTGCSVWFDRERDLTIILLSNRIHPQVGSVDMTGIRRRIGTLAFRLFG
jgi:CubicO group peptidase (beta-lactamase class C family)